MGKDLGHHLAAQRGQCPGLQHTASQQQTQLLLHSTRLASFGVCQIWQGDTRSTLPSSHFPFRIWATGGQGLSSTQDPHRILLPSPPAIQALAQSQASATWCGHRRIQEHQTKPTVPQCCSRSRGQQRIPAGLQVSRPPDRAFRGPGTKDKLER